MVSPTTRDFSDLDLSVLHDLEDEAETETKAAAAIAPVYHSVDNKFRAEKAVFRMRKMVLKAAEVEEKNVEEGGKTGGEGDHEPQVKKIGHKSNFAHFMVEVQLKVRSGRGWERVRIVRDFFFRRL